jgi:hypothetical protein
MWVEGNCDHPRVLLFPMLIVPVLAALDRPPDADRGI